MKQERHKSISYERRVEKVEVLEVKLQAQADFKSKV